MDHNTIFLDLYQIRLLRFSGIQFCVPFNADIGIYRKKCTFQLISHFLHKYCDETAEEKMSQKCKSLAGKYRENSGSMVIEGRFKVNQGALNLSHNLISF